MKIIFMGTPEFSVPALKKLIDSKHEIVAVYTREPKQSGRGYSLTRTPIHELALQNGIEVVTPKTLRNSESQAKFSSFNADIAVVVAYGLLLPKEILEAPKHGCINIHPSLLPRWRGAAPIQRTVMAGDKETGVSIMQLDEGMDSGDVIAVSDPMPITHTTTAGELHDILSEQGSKLLLKVLDDIESGIATFTKQQEELVTIAPKISKADEKIDWRKTASEIDRQIRALGEYPGVYFEYKGERIKVIKAQVEDAQGIDTQELSVGQVVDNKLGILCGDGSIIRPAVLQKQGKKLVDLKAFLNGNVIGKGEILV